MLPGVQSAVVRQSGDPGTVISWPDSGVPAVALTDAATLAETQQAPVTLNDTDGLIIAQPLVIEGNSFGSIALLLSSEQSQEAVIRQLIGWSVAWLELLLRSKTGSGETGTTTVPTSPLMPLLAGIVDLELPIAARTLVTQLAEVLSADRVSLGLLTASDVELQAVSHRPDFDARINLVGMIEAAMQEAILAGQAISITRLTATPDYVAHQLLLRHLNDRAILTVPMGSQNSGALLIERSRAFTADEISAATELALVAGPVFEQIRQTDRGMTGLLQLAMSRWTRKFTDQWWTPGRMVAGLTVALIVLLLAAVDGNFDVKSKAVLEGQSQQSVVAPFNGFIKTAQRRAGDIVTANAVLGTMDDKDLVLEQSRLINERDDMNRQYRQALAELDQSQALILKARVEQADARLAQLARRLQQLELRAPIAGVIISGDLSRALGAPLEKGDILFEIAPVDAFKVVLRISENDIDEIQTGQSGLVTFSAHPDIKIPYEVAQVTSVLNAESGEGVIFRTEATLSGDYTFLRPGMEGYGRTSIGERKLGWILFHDLIDWWRLMIWRLTP